MDDQEVITRLYRRRNEAVLVDQATLGTDEHTSKLGHCHENVSAYLVRHPDCKAVRGWLIGNHGTFLYFNAHSLVETEDGQLIDITPSRPPCLFLRHPGSDEEFAEIIAATPRLLHDLPSEAWPDFSDLDLGQEDFHDE